MMTFTLPCRFMLWTKQGADLSMAHAYSPVKSHGYCFCIWEGGF